MSFGAALRRLVLVVAAIGPVHHAAAQERAAAATQTRMRVPPNHWVVDYGDVRCSLVHRLSGPQSPLLILSSYLGRDEPEFIIMQDGDALPTLPRRLQVVLSPSGDAADAQRVTRRVQGGTITVLRDLGEGFFDRFAASDSVRLQSAGQVLAEMRMVNARQAVAAVKSCNDDLLRSWGADPALGATLQRRPRHTGGSISYNDYPRAAVANHQSGTVVSRLSIGADGRVSDCVTVVSSRVQSLDALTCERLRRFTYDPALDANGRPVAFAVIQTVRWSLAED